MSKTKIQANNKLKIRLARIKGQINGLEQMLGDKKDCLEIFNQLAAIKGALLGLGLVIMEDETNCLRIDKKDQKKFNQILDRFLKVN